MFAPRRNLLYKRPHKGAHLGHAARAPTSSSGEEKVAVTTSDSKTTDPATTSVASASQTTTTSPSSVSSPSSTPATSTSSPSSSPPTSASSSASKSSSTTPTAPSTASTALTVASPTTAHAPSVTTQLVPGVSSTPSSTASPATTSSADSSSGPSTSAIVGGVAGALAGIAVLGFLLMWCMRRQRNRDVDDFDAQAFKRQSAILVDDPVEPSRSYNPRPPTMIERHNASPALAAQGGYGQNFYGSYGGYSQQPPYAPPEMIQPTGSPPPQAYGAPSMGYTGYNDPQQRIARQPSSVGHAAYDSQQQLARQPSNAEYLTRQPSSAAGYAPPTAPPGSFDPNAQYIDLNRSSISPYQAAQYADISRQLGTTDSSAEVPHKSLQLPDGPLPSPFDDPIEATPVPNASPYAHQVHPSSVAAPGPVPAPQTQGNATEPHQRPTTVYEEGDAYGGI